MEVKIEGKPAFAHIKVKLAPGETITAEPDAMATMSSALDMSAKLNGGFFGGLVKKYLGKESLFINHFTNNTKEVLELTLTQDTPGDIHEMQLNDSSYCLQNGAYIASTPGISLGVKWAGISSWIGGEGLFKLQASGTGKVYFGAYGALLERKIEGEFIVDTSHLVGYETHMQLKTQLAGGIFSSIFGGEGFVTRIKGTGTVWIQTRSISGLAKWINKYL